MIPATTLRLIACCVAILLSSCNSVEQKTDCNTPLLQGDYLFIHGGILDKWDNGREFVSIQRIHDKANWDMNEYFTGSGFSKDKTKLLKVIDKDSCKLKQKYYKYTKAENQP